ncbi:phosphoribosyltransferase family protein [Pseudomonas sp. NW5]|uniref:phosphoribosyltransferase n=1 Tax=Pseudomonas sp. NW5 TaxID=2934934 RepID=UPI0020222F61|nr:phosphoribosyltransferase family protein [Pseudomonas sp. NW5]MCL7461680.1 phosphoribosyltransferase [Pseudomonas sp. NW5]
MRHASSATRLADREAAGASLAEQLSDWQGRANVQVLALPRGGVPVAWAIARRLQLPLDVLVVRKLGLPGHEEYAMGAIAAGGVQVLDEALVRAMGVTPAQQAAVLAREQRELERREQLYRDQQPALWLQGQQVLLVDDGLATGATMHAALLAVRRQQPASIVLVVPVASQEALDRLQPLVDQIVCLQIPACLSSIGEWYGDFSQVSDARVLEILAAARAR